MIKKQNKYSADQLIQAYSMYKKNVDVKEISEKVGMHKTSLYVLMKTLSQYINGEKAITENTSQEYKETVAYFTNNNAIQQPNQSEAVKDEVTELSEKFEEAFTVFQTSIANLVIGMADKRAENIVKAKEKELAEQKEKYEQELMKLQAIIASAKDSSIIGMIQKKWRE